MTHWPLADTFDAAALPAGLYVLGILAVRQREVIVPSQIDSTAEQPREFAGVASGGASTTDSRVKYERSALDEQKRARLLEQLEDLINREKPWLENDLTLPGLAQRAQMSPHHLSQVLNEHIGKNFFDYINELRVREVQRCLRDSRYAEAPVLEIALAAGFNSKAAFNTAFKKFTGTTPGAYRRSPSVMPAA
jgi:AraC-like DNA-binding protein